MDHSLTTQEAQEKLAQFGPNEIKEEQESLLEKIWGLVISPISLMLLAASLLSYAGGKIFDFYLILFLLVFNIGIGLWHEWKTDSAVEKLKEKLSVNVRVMRDDAWKTIPSRLLVPGDGIKLTVGDLVPADIKLTQADNVSINESVLTGESLPKEKKENDKAFSGSFLTTGSLLGTVVATGSNTYFGKTINMVEKEEKRSALEQDILRIARYLVIISIAAVVAMTAFFLFAHQPLGDLLTLDLSLLIAGIPVALPTVMTLIISIGTLELARRNVIVRKLSSLENLANVNLLLTDKTGTLTENKITVARILTYNDLPEKEILAYAALSASEPERNPIDHAIVSKRDELKATLQATVTHFIPADSQRKRSTTTLEMNGKTLVLTVGAPQTVLSLAKITPEMRARFMHDVEQAASEGYRAIAIAAGDSPDEKNTALVGMLLLADPLNSDAKTIIAFLEKQGIDVKMLTGDDIAITKRVIAELGMKGNVWNREEIEKQLADLSALQQTVAFAGVLPEDKYKIVKEEEKKYVVAVTGDGVNDLPAIKAADVGIAVKNSVDALKGAADIVLLSPGLAVIRDAFIESRKIFARLYSYSLYRISESFRLIITVLVLGIVYRSYPLAPIQLILLAFLNDVPIVTLAFDRVRAASRPVKIETSKRFVLSTLFGSVGTLNSLLFFFFAINVFHVPFPLLQTMFFLKLTVSGHMLIYVAHTAQRWWKFLPSYQVIVATFATQIVASLLALFGVLMPQISLGFVAVVWLWALFWMQITEGMKMLQAHFLAREKV